MQSSAKDLEGIITSWNSGAEHIFGYLAEEIVGKPNMFLIPPDCQKEEERSWSEFGAASASTIMKPFGSASMGS